MTYPIKGGPMHGHTREREPGEDVCYYSLVSGSHSHRYEFWNNEWRYQGCRNIIKNGFDRMPALRQCHTCGHVQRKYMNPCEACGYGARAHLKGH